MATPATVQVPRQLVVVLDSTVTLDTVLLVMDIQVVLLEGCGHKMCHVVKRVRFTQMVYVFVSVYIYIISENT